MQVQMKFNPRFQQEVKIDHSTIDVLPHEVQLFSFKSFLKDRE